MPLPASMLAEYGPAAVARGYNTYNERVTRDNNRYGFTGSNGLLRRAVLPAAGFAAAPTLGSFLGGSSAAASGGSTAIPAGFSYAPAAGGAMTAVGQGMSLGKFLNSDLLGLGVNSVMSILGNRANSRAQQEALAAQTAANNQAHALQLQSLADARAANDAQNEMRRRELAASEEDRAFNRRLIEEREARLAPYRAMSERARMSLASFLGLR